MKRQSGETTELKDIMIGFLEHNREEMISLAEWFLTSVPGNPKDFAISPTVSPNTFGIKPSTADPVTSPIRVVLGCFNS